MIIAHASVGLAGVLSVWFTLAYCWRGPSTPKSIVKTASVGALVLAAVALSAPLLLIVALGLGALGDYFLSRDGDRAFLAGLIAFALAHLAYIALIVQFGGTVVPGVASLLIVLLASGMAALLFGHAGKLRWPVVVYVGIIAAMGLFAIGLPAGSEIAIVAAVLFMLSDAVLGTALFVLNEKSPLRRVTPFVIWTTYWAAQFLFLVAFAPYSPW